MYWILNRKKVIKVIHIRLRSLLFILSSCNLKFSSSVCYSSSMTCIYYQSVIIGFPLLVFILSHYYLCRQTLKHTYTLYSDTLNPRLHQERLLYHDHGPCMCCIHNLKFREVWTGSGLKRHWILILGAHL